MKYSIRIIKETLKIQQVATKKQMKSEEKEENDVDEEP